MGDSQVRIAIVVSTSIVIAIKIGKIAALDVDTDPVVFQKPVACRVQGDGVLVNLTRFDQFSYLCAVSIARSHQSIAQFLGEAIGMDIDQLGNEICVRRRRRCE